MFAKPNPKKQLWLNNRERELRDRKAREEYIAKGRIVPAKAAVS